MTRSQEQLERQHRLQHRQSRRLARKIHDDISQKMTLLSLQLSLAATDEAPPADWSNNCQTWADMVMDLGQTIREITAELQPRISEETGLKTALGWLAQSSMREIACIFHEPKEEIFLPVYASNELFAICREVIKDILIPGKSRRAELTLEQASVDVCLTLRAEDLESVPEKAWTALDLDDRVQAIDGAVAWQHEPGKGLVLTISVPTEHPIVCDAA